MPRTPEQKALRRAKEQLGKVFMPKVCSICREFFIPKFQWGTKRWESIHICSDECRAEFSRRRCRGAEFRKKKNAARRGDSELHKREYWRRIEREGGTRWQLGDEAAREDMRRRNRERFHREMAKDGDYAAERRANAKHQNDRRKRDKQNTVLTAAEQRKCKALRLAAQAMPGDLHVDHMLPLKLGGPEHPGNLQIITAAPNLFWGDRLKACPWPKPDNWKEPRWEPD